jgi:hypothetical protein
MSATELANREQNAAPSAGDDRLLEGRWLTVARAGWVALTFVVIGLNVLGIPKTYALIQSVCQPGAHCNGLQLTAYDLHLLRQLNLTAGFLSAYNIVSDLVALLVCCTLAALLIWRRSHSLMPVYCASGSGRIAYPELTLT